MAGIITLSDADRHTLLEAARAAVLHGVEHRQAMTIDPASYAPVLRTIAATFVTLHVDGQLQGCVGTLEASRPLIADVVHHAYQAAFDDPRFAPLEEHQVPQLVVHISILDPAEEMTFTDEAHLLVQLRPGIDGLILEEPGGLLGRRRRGTFLPSVWEMLPQPAAFVAHLKRKAGLPMDHWSPRMRVWRYTTQSVP
ncbi:MAG: AmmeMemoRadiSam system protein A [Phycisphaeraceae bacterium]